jgi:hypothetical protein
MTKNHHFVNYRLENGCEDCFKIMINGFSTLPGSINVRYETGKDADTAYGSHDYYSDTKGS